MDRVEAWVNSAPDTADRKVLARLVPWLFFVGVREFEALYQTAFSGPVARWLIDDLGIQLIDPNAKASLAAAVRETWFCPITDSMQISKFYHLNNIEGIDLRPDWRALAEFATEERVAKYMDAQNPSLRRIVLLEDFVGSGTQLSKAVDFVLSWERSIPILLCPLIICPEGAAIGKQLQAKYSNLRFVPVLEIPSTVLLEKNPVEGEPNAHAEFRDVAARLHSLVEGSSPKQLYGPFGYRDTGALVVMHSNCPDNAPPIIHHDSDTWSALFPRSSRL